MTSPPAGGDMALQNGLVDAEAGLSGASSATLRRDSSHAAADLYNMSGDTLSSRRVILQPKVSYAHFALSPVSKTSFQTPSVASEGS